VLTGRFLSLKKFQQKLKKIIFRTEFDFRVDFFLFRRPGYIILRGAVKKAYCILVSSNK